MRICFNKLSFQNSCISFSFSFPPSLSSSGKEAQHRGGRSWRRFSHIGEIGTNKFEHLQILYYGALHKQKMVNLRASTKVTNQ